MSGGLSVYVRYLVRSNESVSGDPTEFKQTVLDSEPWDISQCRVSLSDSSVLPAEYCIVHMMFLQVINYNSFLSQNLSTSFSDIN